MERNKIKEEKKNEGSANQQNRLCARSSYAIQRKLGDNNSSISMEDCLKKDQNKKRKKEKGREWETDTSFCV